MASHQCSIFSAYLILLICPVKNGGITDPHDFSNSQTLIPARESTSVDWQSVNRLVEENRDFKDFIELVGEYHQTGKIHKTLWNK